MKSPVAIVAAVSVLALSACAASRPSPEVARPMGGKYLVRSGNVSNKDETYVCRPETMVGSHIKRHVCLTPEEAAEQRKNSQSALQDAQRGQGRAANDPATGL